MAVVRRGLHPQTKTNPKQKNQWSNTIGRHRAAVLARSFLSLFFTQPQPLLSFPPNHHHEALPSIASPTHPLIASLLSLRSTTCSLLHLVLEVVLALHPQRVQARLEVGWLAGEWREGKEERKNRRGVWSDQDGCGVGVGLLYVYVSHPSAVRHTTHCSPATWPPTSRAAAPAPSSCCGVCLYAHVRRSVGSVSRLDMTDKTNTSTRLSLSTHTLTPCLPACLGKT
jgi:hypothetical protein